MPVQRDAARFPSPDVPIFDTATATSRRRDITLEFNGHKIEFGGVLSRFTPGSPK
ncbi:MAG: hypothetical protein AAGA28_01130 [Pseudomonadota bacterium]